MIETVEGDILELFTHQKYTGTVHGCNCFHIMGGGLAKVISSRYHQALEVDKRTPRGGKDKLSTCSYTVIDSNWGNKFIFNAYTQYQPGPNASYHFAESAITYLCRILKMEVIPPGTAITATLAMSSSLGYPSNLPNILIPKIGCGIGGLDWGKMKLMLERTIEEQDMTDCFTFVEYD
ncbi:MAG: macro domain-containing protein [Candidatus Peribacteraceae bacterium]|nr:macro domain-containing protein [Candidatus Peribacteraceae bacterium]